MLDILTNIAISLFFQSKRLVKTIYKKSKKAIAIAWPFIVKMYKRSILVIGIFYVAVCFILIDIFEKEED